MHVNAINAYSNNVNFGRRKVNNTKPATVQEPVQQPRQYSKAPLYAAMVLLPLSANMTSCDPIRVSAKATASTTVTVKDTLISSPNDTIIKNDTIYLPADFEFPQEIQDSLNIWRGDYLDTSVDGDDGDLRNKALLYMSALRAWDYNKRESAKLNLKKSDATEARYDHTIYDPKTNKDSIVNDIRITLVKPGDLTVVRKDGTITNQVSGLLFNEDGVKSFAHSNGKDKIFVYEKQMSGENVGKYVFKGTIEPGYLTNPAYGKTILLNGMLAAGTEDHYTNVKGKVMDVADIAALEPNESWEIE